MRETVLAVLASLVLSGPARAQMGPFDYGQTTDGSIGAGNPAPLEPPKVPPLEANGGGAAKSLVASGNANLSGTPNQVKADAGQSFDGNAPRPDAVNVGAPERIDLAPSGGFNRGQWSGDGSQKPAGFEDIKDDKKKDEPGFLEKAGKFIKDLGMGGWLLKCGLVIALLGIMTFNPTVMWIGFGTILAGGLWTALFGS